MQFLLETERVKEYSRIGFHLASNHFLSLHISRIINYKCIWKLNQGNVFQGVVIWSNLCQHFDEENLAIYIRTSPLTWSRLGWISWFFQQIHEYKSTVPFYLVPQITRTSSKKRRAEICCSSNPSWIGNLGILGVNSQNLKKRIFFFR